jgi:pyridoxamine 5'-phosphate oxidase
MRSMTDPFALFDQWFAEARAAEINDPEAMAVATADAHGRPSVRMVLLKGHGPEGFVFYTNEESAKGGQLRENPRAALLFHWKSLRRQVRIEGTVERVSPEDSDAYFATRSRDSQLGAWASDQSQPLESRELFERRYEEMKARYDGQPVPRPPHWGGFRVVPARFEFWQDRPHRLHERRIFVAQDDGGWDEGLLYP